MLCPRVSPRVDAGGLCEGGVFCNGVYADTRTVCCIMRHRVSPGLPSPAARADVTCQLTRRAVLLPQADFVVPLAWRGTR